MTFLKLTFLLASFFGLLTVGDSAFAAEKATLNLAKRNKIVIIGNTFAERMQDAGDFETLLHARFPKLELTIRNLGWSADELTLRPRSKDFDDHGHKLTDHKPDVIIACFGYNESFSGKAGLQKFKTDLAAFIKTTTTTKYNGKTAPQLVLVSPIANENVPSRNIKAADWNNANIKLYTAAMRELAIASNVPFVDLYEPSLKMMAARDAKNLMTINGAHLKITSYEPICKVMHEALFGSFQSNIGDVSLETLRTTVREKNLEHWYDYRAVNGYYIYGGRKKPFGVENFPAEFVKLRKIVRNGDRRIWSFAQGNKVDCKISDKNTGEFAKIKTNINFKVKINPPEESLKSFTVPEGYEVNLFASEKEFPELKNPVQFTFDAKGRLWVCTMPTYPMYLPGTPVNDKILILEDTDGDGKADKQTVFAEGLHLPTGFELGDGGAYVANQPNLLFLKDTDGDDVADVRTTVLHGFDSADSHHSEGAFEWGPGGALYFMEGTFHHTQVETPYGPERVKNAAVFRYEPKSGKFGIFTSYPFANPWGQVFDKWGQNWVADASGGANYFGAAFTGDVNYPHKHSRMKRFLKKQWRPTAGCEIVSSRNFPDNVQGNYLLNNCIGFQGVLQYQFKEDGAGRKAEPVEPLLSSTDLNFRPVDIQFGPDGALYLVDWFNPLVGHMQHNVRDPNRDKNHGRIWRIRYKNKPLVKRPVIAGKSIPQLLELLKTYEDRTRYQVRLELRLHPSEKVKKEVDKWVANLDSKDKGYNHLLLEALWVLQNHDVVDEGLLSTLLASDDFRARAAATRVLCYWRGRVNQPLALLTTLSKDAHPRVRLEAVRALSFFRGDDAAKAIRIAVPMIVTNEGDEYLDYTLTETLRTLGQRSTEPIAGILLTMLQKGDVPKNRINSVVKELSLQGNPKQLAYLFEQAIAPKGKLSFIRVNVLRYLADAVRSRKIKPAGDLSKLRTLIDPKKPVDSTQVAAIQLAGLWKLSALAEDLRQLAMAKNVKGSTLRAVLSALAEIGGETGKGTMKKLASTGQQDWVRNIAIGSLAEVDLKLASGVAANFLKKEKLSKGYINSIIAKFLDFKTGSKELASALSKDAPPKENAKMALQYMYSVGRSDAELSGTLSKAAGITGEVPKLSKEQLVALSKKVLAQGDAKRGEMIFRRTELSCAKCHALSKAGGVIGPDLSAVGGSSPVEYLIQSLIAPSEAIKEAYKTSVLITDKGKSYTGIVTKRAGLYVWIREANGKERRLPKSSIIAEQEGESLMPKGLAQFLTDQDFLDLVKFLSKLGKTGEYAIRTRPTIQRWRVLQSANNKARLGKPGKHFIKSWIINYKGNKWTPLYAKVAGGLPVNEIRKHVTARESKMFIKGEIDVTVAGDISLKILEAKGVLAWVDGTPAALNGKKPVRQDAVSKVNLKPGRHQIIFRIDSRMYKKPDFNAEVIKPTGSTVQFTVVGGV